MDVVYGPITKNLIRMRDKIPLLVQSSLKIQSPKVSYSKWFEGLITMKKYEILTWVSQYIKTLTKIIFSDLDVYKKVSTITLRMLKHLSNPLHGNEY